MDLFMAVPVAFAKHVVNKVFVGRSVSWNEGDESEVCEFRDMPSVGLTLSRTTETEAERKKAAGDTKPTREAAPPSDGVTVTADACIDSVNAANGREAP